MSQDGGTIHNKMIPYEKINKEFIDFTLYTGNIENL